MKRKGMTQSDLVNTSALSKTTISRICRNSNDKGGPYSPERDVVMAVSIGLKLSEEEHESLFSAAFPEEAVWKEIKKKQLDILQANELLYDNGLPLLGNFKDE